MFLTIFTPIYNRERYVNRLFDTIEKQEYKDFEWIIINDGSTDKTEEKIKNKIKSKEFSVPITFITTANEGKQRAINKAVSIAKGKYFFILDSDDTLFPTTTKLINKWCEEIEQLPNYKKYAGVSGLRITQQGNYLSGIGVRKKKYIDASNLERYKYNLEGDMAEVYKTSILKRFPFKVFKNENFVSEETVWNKIASKGYIIRWHISPIYIGEYLSDGLTKNAVKRDIKNYQGLIFQTKESIRLKPFKKRILAIGYFVNISRKKGYSFDKIKKYINISRINLFIYYNIWRVFTLIKQ